MRVIPSSELIINEDGTIFHLHLLPEQLADKVIMVGDPGRVDLIASFFERVEYRVENREFRSVTGWYRGVRFTALSTGIGIGNIDISVTELDALANVDLSTRQVKSEFRQLTLLRLGTSGALQPDIKVGEFVLARTSVGFDGLLNYYQGCDEICDLSLERSFREHVGWSERLPSPYFVDADKELCALFEGVTREGVTIASPGFYAPQGRHVRLRPADGDMNSKIESFSHQGRVITNYEMESSVLAGLAKLMGHRAATICTIIAQRVAQDVNTDYKPFVTSMIEMALDKLVELDN
ncbi:MAG: nucleoside phosphorylase [Rikenellaceae bacterium]